MSKISSRIRIDSKEVLVLVPVSKEINWPYLILFTRRGAGPGTVFKCFTCDGIIPLDFADLDRYSDDGKIVWSKVRDEALCARLIKEVKDNAQENGSFS